MYGTKARIDKIKEYLQHEASRKTCEELYSDYTPGVTGNYDDAYSDGVDDGGIFVARNLLKILEDGI